MRLLAPCRQLIGPLPSIQLIGGSGVGGFSHQVKVRFLCMSVWQSGVENHRAFISKSRLAYNKIVLPKRSFHNQHTEDITKRPFQLVRQTTELSSRISSQVRTKHTQHHPSQLKRRSRKVERTELPQHFKMEWPKITLFGDSITRRSFDVDNGCWASMLAFKANSFFDVDPRGFEGYNSKWALELMPKLFPKSYLDKVEIFVLFFGHNDSWEMPPLNVPVDQYDNNMRAIVKYLLDQGVARSKIILITPSWFYLPAFKDYTKSLGMPEVKKELDDCEKYSETVKRIGADERLEVVDLFAVTAKYEPLEELFCDGVHFSRTGAKLLYDHLMPVVEKKIETTFKKPLADLWHAVPFDQHPELVPVMEAWTKKMKEEEEEAAAEK